MRMLTSKQKEVIRCIKTEDPKILICSGAKRAGKTYVLILAFLGHIARYKNKGVSFIIGGATQASIRRNVLNDMEQLVCKELRPDKSGCIKIFGNNVYCLDGDNVSSWKKVRGFTAAGAFLNEGTALHDTFVKEVISRCSYKGARIFIDTNPENPNHTIKVDYIDKDGQKLDNGRINIRKFDFTLFDNDTLDPEYVDSIIKSTPSGMFTDRDIYGRWVTAEGIIYRDFDSNKHYITQTDVDKLSFERYFAGVDWGYEHFGSVTVFGAYNDEYVLIEEYAAQHKEIEYWVEIAKQIKNKYGNIPFYCDSARPEHVARFRREHIKAFNADKSVISGIEQVARLFKADKLLIIDKAERFKKEIMQYAWNDRTGEPIKQFDDVMDSMRYAIYNDYKASGRKGRDLSALAGL